MIEPDSNEGKAEKIEKGYEFSWERLKFIGFKPVLIVLTVTLVVLVFFIIFTILLPRGESIPIEVLILIILIIQAFFIYSQTRYFQTQQRFLKNQAAPQLIPYTYFHPSLGKTLIYVKNTKKREAHNVFFKIDMVGQKRQTLKTDSIGTITKTDKILLADLDKKDFFENKIIIDFHYNDVMLQSYSSRYMKKRNSEALLFIGLK
jgi:hypothetical protein